MIIYLESTSELTREYLFQADTQISNSTELNLLFKMVSSGVFNAMTREKNRRSIGFLINAAMDILSVSAILRERNREIEREKKTGYHFPSHITRACLLSNNQQKMKCA